MTTILAAARSKITDFLKATHAVAAVEFAFVGPLMLVIYLGAVDLSQAVTADRKLATVAGTLGDLVAQVRTDLRESALDDYFLASQAIMTPFRGDETEMLLAILQVDDDGIARVVQSRVRNGATALGPGTVFTLPAEMQAISTNGFVVVAQAWYDYRPLVGYVLDHDIRLQKSVYFIPRFGDIINIIPG